MTIRPFEKSDYDELVPIWNAVYPDDRYTVAEAQYFDESIQAPQKFGRLVAEKEAKLVGAAEYIQFPGMFHPQKFFLRVYVSPQFERQGVGGALFEALMETLKPFDPISVRTQVAEDQSGALKFARTRGFVESKRDWFSILELGSFNSEPYQDLIETLKAQDIRFASLAELGTTAEVERNFHELFSDVRQDVPRSEPATAFSYEAFQKMVIDAPDFSSEGTFLALDKGELIGMTMFWKGDMDDDFHTGLTGVRRAYRGRGIATALKVSALSYAKSVGAPRVHTDNDTSNVEMIAINDKLGFVKQPARISMLKILKEA